jgi:hypothetical protein
MEKANELSEEIVEKELDELGRRCVEVLLGRAVPEGALFRVLESGKTRVTRASSWFGWMLY